MRTWTLLDAWPESHVWVGTSDMQWTLTHPHGGIPTAAHVLRWVDALKGAWSWEPPPACRLRVTFPEDTPRSIDEAILYHARILISMRLGN